MTKAKRRYYGVATLVRGEHISQVDVTESLAEAQRQAEERQDALRAVGTISWTLIPVEITPLPHREHTPPRNFHDGFVVGPLDMHGKHSNCPICGTQERTP